MKVRAELIIEISQLIHVLSLRGTKITFLWIPSHCGFYFSDLVDAAAKLGAKRSEVAYVLQLPYSLQECYSILMKTYRNHISLKDVKFESRHNEMRCLYKFANNMNNNPYCIRNVLSSICRWKINAFRTKYVTNCTCICGNALDSKHILICNMLQNYAPVLQTYSTVRILNDPPLLCDLFKEILLSPVGLLL